MAVENIGALVPTKIPGYADAADIQAALRAYHYGSLTFDPAETDPEELLTPSIAKTIYDIQSDITTLENRPSSGGDVDDDAPVAGDFTPEEIPNGYIWVDSNGTIGGQPTSATAIFTNSSPTTSLTTGLIWVDKDAQSVTANPFIPQAVISAKGDLIVGTANDTAGILFAGTNGQVLKANSSTTTGLEWGTDNNYLAPTIGSTSIASGATVTSISGLTLDAPSTNYAVMRSPEEKFNVVAAAATGTINIDMETAGIWYYTSNATANHTLNFRYSSSTTLNNSLATGDAITFVWMNTNGVTPYYPSAITVDGTSVTPKFQNATAFSAGNASSIDIYTYTVLKTGNAAFTVFAGQTRFA
jgi:hypothetical protein